MEESEKPAVAAPPRRVVRPVRHPPLPAGPAGEDRIAYLEDLIKWIAPRIVRRNGNGMPADQFCLLCVMGTPEYKRQPCRHAEIWAAAKDAD